MNEHLGYYRRRLKDVWLYLRLMPDLSIRSFLALSAIFIAAIGFLIGDTRARAGFGKDEVAVTGAIAFAPYPTAALSALPEKKTDGKFIAGGNSGVYYAKSCKGWKRIAKKNQIWFDTEKEAIDAGFARASRCK